MNYRKDLGAKGEQKAAKYLQKKGYEILEKNWRYKKTEIDIIAGYEGKIVFVEVKTRQSLKYGYPEESVNATKIESLQKAAEAYLFERNDNPDIRFDVIAISPEDGMEKIEHFEDAF